MELTSVSLGIASFNIWHHVVLFDERAPASWMIPGRRESSTFSTGQRSSPQEAVGSNFISGMRLALRTPKILAAPRGSLQDVLPISESGSARGRMWRFWPTRINDWSETKRTWCCTTAWIISSAVPACRTPH
jgi:hypothetical protein